MRRDTRRRWGFHRSGCNGAQKLAKNGVWGLILDNMPKEADPAGKLEEDKIYI